MSFLQPLFLIGLPLIALPVIIHLINQRRYQTVQWAAMMFLLTANRMSRGYARLRQRLILAFRTLAILGLIFALARPLASGSLGAIAGGKPDTTVILLDRSPSMQARGAGSVLSKLESGRRQLAQTLGMLGSVRWVLVESTSNQAREIESPDALLELPSTGASDSSADLPAMLESTRDYIQANKTGRTEVWICSDVRRSDWHEESGRWQAIRDSFLELPQGIRFHLLAYPEIADDNISIRVTNVRRQQQADGAELLVSLRVTRDGDNPAPSSLPIQFEIEGARSEVAMEVDGATFDMKDHRISIDSDQKRGWGRVSIPADSNPADNEFYFVFDAPSPRRTIVVSDDLQVSRILGLAAAIAPDPSVDCTSIAVASDEFSTADRESLSLVLWHAPLPDEQTASELNAFVDRGGQVVFLPPASPSDHEFRGVSWLDWVDKPDGIPVETWRGDLDILAHSLSGLALPVGQLQIRRYCGIEGELTDLASLKGGDSLLARLPTDRGAIYFCATTPTTGDSSLASNGVVLYVTIQRAMAAGAAALAKTVHVVAGDDPGDTLEWRQVAGPPDTISTEYAHRSGVYNSNSQLLAVNRHVSEDESTVLTDDRVASLFDGLEYSRVDDRAGRLTGLVQEIWRLFLAAMLIALLAEAALCLPRRATVLPGARQPGRAAVESGNGTTEPESPPRVKVESL